MTADQMAVRILLSSRSDSSKQTALSSLYRKVTAAAQNRVECPACGHEGPHEDNGCRGSELAYLCQCGEQFDAQ